MQKAKDNKVSIDGVAQVVALIGVNHNNIHYPRVRYRTASHNTVNTERLA
jgi:hypothetical protein